MIRQWCDGSGAFPGDSLIAVEVTRTFEGKAVVTPRAFGFEDDLAIACQSDAATCRAFPGRFSRRCAPGHPTRAEGRKREHGLEGQHRGGEWRTSASNMVI